MVCCERELHVLAAQPAAGTHIMKIAIQGEPGAFSHEAALKLVPGAELVPCALSAEVFAALDAGAVDAPAMTADSSTPDTGAGGTDSSVDTGTDAGGGMDAAVDSGGVDAPADSAGNG